MITAEPDSQAADFRGRPLDAARYRFVAADALGSKVREGRRVVNVHALLVTGVNADGHWEILSLQVTSAEDGVGRLAFFRYVTARGSSGVRRSPPSPPRSGHRNRDDPARCVVAAPKGVWHQIWSNHQYERRTGRSAAAPRL